MGAEQSSALEEVTSNKVNFFINGVEHNVNTESMPHLGPQTLLVDYIRDEADLKGTKFSCREGGCGACVVCVKSKDPASGADVIRPVNSCLTPLFSCDGWDITTIEGLGNKKDGYHEIQKRLVTFNGTQCGYCTPGMVMNMHSLMNSRSGAKMKDIEDNFDGNICRCTGYRPILDAFKSLGLDATEELRRKCADMEDFGGSPCPLKKGSCKYQKSSCCDDVVDDNGGFDKLEPINPIHLALKSGEQWVKPTRLDNLFSAMQQFMSAGLSYRLVAGNTATGIYKYDGPYQAYLDITAIPQLKTISLESRAVVLGGSITLASAIEQLLKASTIDGFEYAEQMSKHIQRVANVPVRSNGTLAGNLMIKHDHPEFPSDIFMLLETVGASLSIASAANLQRMYPVLDFLKLDMTGKVILSINLPPLPKSRGYVLRTFKITRRYQNAHAYVNAGFLFRIDPRRNFSIREKPSIVFGGINPEFAHANATEIYLLGKFLGDAKTVAGALDALDREVLPDHHPPDATPEYRKALTVSLLYKTILGIVGTTAEDKVRSGAGDIEHGVTYGKQSYETDKTEWPLNQPVSKLEATIQCSGEAEYVNDIVRRPGELTGAFVLSTVANARLKSVDASEALRIPGVVSFLQAKDIPGTNNYYLYAAIPEEIFVTDQVKYAGAAIGLIVAETREIALKATQKVKVTYDNIKKPILTIAEALAKAETEGKMAECFLKEKGESPTLASGNSKHTLKGEVEILGQFHFQMENHAALCIPTEDGMDVFATTQWIDLTQATVAAMLQIPNNCVNVQVRRLGGGYGSKISRGTHVTAACALAAHITNKPIRMVLDLEASMKMMGKRLPYLGKYDVGFDDNGKIDRLDAQLFCDGGIHSNEITSALAMVCLQSCYETVGWNVAPGAVNTNKVSNTYCRSPGSTQGFAIIETIMEHIAFYLGKDPLDVKMANQIKTGDPIYSVPGFTFDGVNLIPQMIEELKRTSDYDDRKKFIETFNSTNRWKKRGMAVMPMRYPVHYFSVAYPAFVTIYHVDGTVAISHGGIEMGQGINTKAAQGAAYELKIPLDKIKVKPSNNFTCANSMITGGAITSELVTHSTVQACKILNERLQPIREKIKDGKWESIITAANSEGVNLTANHMPNASDNLQVYDVWGVNLTEVEIDMLTGEYKIIRVDVIEDCGISLSPEIDVGQVEGAMVMGLGLWTTEKLQYDETTGELLTMNTWDYKPPMPKDIPEDLRISFLKNAPNPFGVLRSKATGEPPLCMAVNVIFAMRNAINSARKDAGLNDYYQLDGPVTPEDILRHSGTTKSQFTF